MVANGVTLPLTSLTMAEAPDPLTPSDQSPSLTSVDGLDPFSSSHPVDGSAYDVKPAELDTVLESQENKYEELTTRIVPEQSQMPLIHHNHHDSRKLSPSEQWSEPNPLNAVVVMHEPLYSYQDSSMEETTTTHSVFINLGDLPSSDGFNWRKYGQKHIKNSNSSRSYYRCTFPNCHAKKKVQIGDQSGHPVEIVYKGNHNHDPPEKIRCIKSRRMLSSDLSPVKNGGNFVTEMADGSGFSPMLALVNTMMEYQRSEPKLLLLQPPPEELCEGLNNMNKSTTAESNGKCCCDDPKSKQRVNEKSLEYPTPLVKSVKEQKIVLYATGDVDISSDGYRWRKYGQKKVKGNPHPRSYYRCTYVGCPVRKHVERASEEETGVTILSYEGNHNHDMPLPKRRSPCCDDPAGSASSSPVSETVVDLGGDIALESAQTLLSIHLKP